MMTDKSSKLTRVRHILSSYLTHIELENKRNLTDINLEAEDVFCTILNILWATDLKNINKENSYSAGIDLYDEYRKIFVQVSTNGSKKKIDSSLKSFSKSHPKGHFYFLCLKVEHRIPTNINIPDGVEFNPSEDFFDCNKLIKMIENSDDSVINEVFEFLRTNQCPIDMGQLTSDLGVIVQSLIKNPEIDQMKPSLITPELQDKIEINDLLDMQSDLEEWSSFCGILDQVYSQFERFAITAVQSRVKKSYIKCKSAGKRGCDLFYAIEEELLRFIMSLDDFSNLSCERLEYGLYIVVTDTFMRCMIFEKAIQKEEYNGFAR